MNTEVRLELWLENLPQCLLDDPVDHVGNAKGPFAPSGLRNHLASGWARAVGSFAKGLNQTATNRWPFRLNILNS